MNSEICPPKMCAAKKKRKKKQMQNATNAGSKQILHIVQWLICINTIS